MKSLFPFAFVWHIAQTQAGPVSALRSPRGILTQPLEQVVSGYLPLPHWNQAVHIERVCAVGASRLTRSRLPFTKVTFVETICDAKCQITFDFEPVRSVTSKLWKSLAQRF